MFAGPFITIHGNPLLLMNIVERKFVVLGQIFWPQDMIIFAVALLVFAVGIIVFTTAFGRLWCGWACPQTVMMEMVFRKIEYAIEGDAPSQRALNRAPWTARKIFQKALKHGIFFALSFVVGNVLLSYIIGWRELVPDHHRSAGPAPDRAGFHDRLFAVVLRHLCAVPRTGLHVHLSLWPVAIPVAR